MVSRKKYKQKNLTAFIYIYDGQLFKERLYGIFHKQVKHITALVTPVAKTLQNHNVTQSICSF